MSKTKWGKKKISEAIKDIETKQLQVRELFENTQKMVEQLSFNSAESDTKLKNILSIESQVNNSVVNIQSIQDEIEELKSSTNKILDTNQGLIEEIKNQLAVAAGGVLSNTFEQRKMDLEKSKKKWFNWLVLDIILLVGVAIFVFLELKSNPSITPNFFLKFSLSFPFVYAAFFFHGQYNKERELLEEYAFKSAIAFSFEAYRKLIKEEIDQEKTEEQNKFLDFILNSIKGIYTSPRELMSNYPNKEDSIEVGVLDKLVEVFKKFIK
jgi:F0F1-type ATP synthase membrane subunit b/b'